MTHLRTLDIISYLVLLTLFILAFLSPWLPPREGPPMKRRIHIQTLMVLVAVTALLLTCVRAAIQDASRPTTTVSS